MNICPKSTEFYPIFKAGTFRFLKTEKRRGKMKEYYVTGLMSGTSLDGLDICHVRFEFPSLKFEIIETKTLAYSDEWVFRLKNSIHLTARELVKLDMDYGFYMGQKVNEFIRENHIGRTDLIASHGHTVFHRPDEGYTLQIGNGAAVCAETRIRTVCDFRAQDVALGGQGAPLVPIGDEMIFGGFDACLNLGGFSNISFRKPTGRIAFDISPMNIVLNRLAEKSGEKYDQDGNSARNGTVSISLLEELNALDYYRKPPPKSLGIEFCIDMIFPRIENSSDKVEDLLATFTEHFAVQISKILNENQIKNVLVTGGGAKNKFLLERLKSMTGTEILIPDEKTVDFKEALIFALMGVLKCENQVNVLSSVTGAKKNHSSGIIYS